MDANEMLQRARESYPPTQIVLETVCDRIGSARQVADALQMGDWGRERVREWKRHPYSIPFSVWLSLLILDEAWE